MGDLNYESKIIQDLSIMHSPILHRTIIILPLLIFAAVNMVGAYYSENLYDFNTFVRAGQVIVSGENPNSLLKRLYTNLNRL